ncbi:MULTISPECIES: hypothetical protein [unclassified Streptomyces]|uniref:hypothetical protein n=1 Tax=unclassified Streptomyces TaxID=2593676 RepID=UPI003D93AC92
MAGPERIIDAAYDLGGLSTRGEGTGLYAAQGRPLWAGRLCGLGPRGVVRLRSEEGCTFVRPAAAGRTRPGAQAGLRPAGRPRALTSVAGRRLGQAGDRHPGG